MCVAQIQLHRICGVEWNHVNGADALMSFIPDPTWDQNTLSANIQVRSRASCFMLHALVRCVDCTLRHAMQAHSASFSEKPCTFMARIHLEYEMQR